VEPATKITHFETDHLYMLAMMKIQHDCGRVEVEKFDAKLKQSLSALGLELRHLEEYIEFNREALFKVIEEAAA